MVGVWAVVAATEVRREVDGEVVEATEGRITGGEEASIKWCVAIETTEQKATAPPVAPTRGIETNSNRTEDVSPTA